MSTLPAELQGRTMLERHGDAPWKDDFVRVLAYLPERDLLVTIPVPVARAQSPADCPPYRTTRYHRAPRQDAWCVVREFISTGNLIPVDLQRPITLMTDEDVARKWTRLPHKDAAQCALHDVLARCRALQCAETKWTLVADLVALAHDCGFDRHVLARAIAEKSATSHKTKHHIYNALHQCLAWGSSKNALRPYLDRCGAPGRTHRQQALKLGRPNAQAAAESAALHDTGVEVRASALPCAGLPLCEADIAHLQQGWSNFVLPGRSVWSAYIDTMATFWSTGELCMVDGYATPLLRPAQERPTFAQFRYWGPRGRPEEAAWRRQISRNRYERTMRAMSGSARDEIRSVGQMGVEDASPTDVMLVSEVSRLRCIGAPNRILIADVFSEILPGFYLGLSAPSQQTMLLALLACISPIVPLAKRFGYAVNEDEWPRIWFARMRTDNGEARTQDLLESLPRASMTIETIPVSRPDWNRAEVVHHHLHKRLDHSMPGSTGGHRKERGEVAAAISACLTYREYMIELLRAMHYHNCHERVPKLLTRDMRRDGVEPYRIDICDWAFKRGYIVQNTPNLTELRARILPVMRARVKPNGVYLLRPDRGKKGEFVAQVRFVSEHLIDTGMLAAARSSGGFDVDVRMDPGDMSTAYLVDSTGAHVLHNADPDDVLQREGSLWSYLAIQDDDHLAEIAAKSRTDQDRLNDQSPRQVRSKEAAVAKSRAINDAGGVTKTQLTGGIAQNRAAEQARIKALNGEALQAPEDTGSDEVAQSPASRGDGYDRFL